MNPTHSDCVDSAPHRLRVLYSASSLLVE